MKTNKHTQIFAATALLSLALLGSCSKGDTSSSEGGNGAILLKSGLELTKAPINTGDLFEAGVAGWETKTVLNYTTPTWQTSAKITATENTAGVIFLQTPQFYNADDATKTYIRAWSPTGTLDAFGNVTFVSDGELDVLLAPEVSGSFTDDDVKKLEFTHLLSQLNFTVQGWGEFVDPADNPKLISITVKAAELPKGIDLKFDETRFDAAADLVVPNIDGMLAINDTLKSAGRSVMMKPFAGQSFLVDVKTSKKDYPGVVVTIDGKKDMAAGTAYLIALHFNQGQILASASVAPWKQGTGHGMVE